MFSVSDAHLLLLLYYGGCFASYSTNCYLLDRIDRDALLYRLSFINDTLRSVVGSNLITPLADQTQGRSTLLELVSSLDSTIVQLNTQNYSFKVYESAAVHLLLAHLHFLTGNNEAALSHLLDVSIDVAGLTNLATRSMEADADIISNYYQYCAIKKLALQTLITKDIAQLDTFFSLQLLNVPSVSNIQARYWLSLLFNIYFKLLSKQQQEPVSFEMLHSRVKPNDLLLIVVSNYFYSNYKSHLSFSFKTSFTTYFRQFTATNVYNNVSLQFPLSNQTNYSLECLINVAVDSIKSSLSQHSYFDSNFSSSDLNVHQSDLLDINDLDSLADFSLGKTYQSIKIFNSLIFLKIIKYQRLNLQTVNLELNYKLMLEIISIFKNFKTFYDLFILKLHKKNIDNKLLDEDYLLLIQTHTIFLQFVISNLNVAENQNFYFSVLDKNSLQIDPSKYKSLNTFNKLLSTENLTLFTDIELSLLDLLDHVQDLANIDLSAIHNSSTFDNDETAHLAESNQLNFLKTKFHSSKVLNFLLSHAYHTILAKKMFYLKINQHYFKHFLESGHLKNLMLAQYKSCLALNEFNNLDYYLEYALFLLRFFPFEKYNATIVFLVKKILGKKFDYWKCWNLLLVLVNGNYGIESTIDLGSLANSQNDATSSDIGLALADNISTIIDSYIKSASSLFDSTFDNRNPINELKNDLVELKLTQILVITQKQGYEDALARVPELFELFQFLFKDYEYNDDEENHGARHESSKYYKAGMAIKKKVQALTRKQKQASGHKQGAIIKDDLFTSGTHGPKLLRFHTFRRRKIAKGINSSLKDNSLGSEKVKVEAPNSQGGAIAETKALANGTTSPSEANTAAAVNNAIFASKTLQKIWLFVADIYLNLNLLKESEYSIIEAENALAANEATLCMFAKVLQRYSSMSLNTKSISLVNKKLVAFNEFERSLEVLNGSLSTTTFRLSESAQSITGLASLVLAEIGSEGDDQDDEDGCDDWFNNGYFDDLDSGRFENEDSDSDSDLGSECENEDYGGANTLTRDTDNISLSSYAPQSSSAKYYARQGGPRNPANSFFMNANDQTLALLRVKLLLENNLLYNYHHHNSLEVWSCLISVYEKVHDTVRYEKALKKFVGTERGTGVRSLEFFDTGFW